MASIFDKIVATLGNLRKAIVGWIIKIVDDINRIICTLLNKVKTKISMCLNRISDHSNLISWLENRSNFTKGIIGPFVVCCKKPVEFFLWFMFVIVAGQLGTIINVVKRCLFDGQSLSVALCPDSMAGNFYTFSLVLLSSLLGPLFVRMFHKEQPEFRGVSIIFVTIQFFAILLCAVFFSFATQNVMFVDYKNLTSEMVVADVPQIMFFILAVTFACYSFGLQYLNEFSVFNSLDEDYRKKEDAEKKKMKAEMDTIKDDGKGTKL